jgi:hypothetical protein
MYALFERYYANATRDDFEADLAEKEFVIVAQSVEDATVRGFTTLRRLRTVVDGEPIAAFYSGDTIVDRTSWGQLALQRVWAATVWQEALKLSDARIYWFLTSCAYRTYRFLPLFFKIFFPCYSAEMPQQVRIDRDSLGRLQFGDQFDSATGVVHFRHATPVREGMADFAESRLHDPHLAFFAQANPGFARGEGLVCLAQISESNLTAAAKRMLGVKT